jgi:ferredoxin-NADP reductase
MGRTAILGRLNWLIGEVIAIHDETESVRSLTLDVPHWSGHRAGQHIDVRLTAEDGYQAERSYSLASPPKESQHITITVERLDDGEVSPYLVDELRIGDKIELRGPIGGYFVWDVPMGGPLLLLAGGSGIVPLMSMIRHRVAHKSDVPVRLLYSSRSYQEIIYREELDLLSHREVGLEVVHTLTRTAPLAWRGYRRRIDQMMIGEVAWPVEQRPLAFVCGPTSFVEVAASHLVSLGYEPMRIKTERFGATGGA